MTQRILVLNISPEEYKKKLKDILRNNALFRDPIKDILEKAWGLLLELNHNEEE